MNEQIYFEQFTGDKTGLPLSLLFESCPPRRNIGIAMYNALIRGGVQTIEDAVNYVHTPDQFRVRLFGIGRGAELYGMLERYGAL